MVSARAIALGLLVDRAEDASVCPSEIARALGAKDWRDHMPVVHDAIDQLLRDGLVRLTWKDKPLTGRTGPYRVRRVGKK